MRKYDNRIVGLVLGLLLPLTIVVVYYFVSANEGQAFGNFIERSESAGVLEKMLSLGCILNLVLVYIFSALHRFHSMRGGLLATMIYVFVILYLKFIT